MFVHTILALQVQNGNQRANMCSRISVQLKFLEKRTLCKYLYCDRCKKSATHNFSTSVQLITPTKPVDLTFFEVSSQWDLMTEVYVYFS